MPTPKRGFRFLVFSFFMVGLILVWYRHAVHEVPFDPGERQNLWSIEAKITFDAQHGPVKVSFATPQSQSGFTYLGERTVALLTQSADACAFPYRPKVTHTRPKPLKKL